MQQLTPVVQRYQPQTIDLAPFKKEGAAQPAAAQPAAADQFTPSATTDSPPSVMSSIAKGAKYGAGVSAVAGAALTVLTCGAFLPVAIVAVPVCTVLGAYVGLVNPEFKS